MAITATSGNYKASNRLMTTHEEMGWVVGSGDVEYGSSLFWIIAIKGIA